MDLGSELGEKYSRVVKREEVEWCQVEWGWSATYWCKEWRNTRKLCEAKSGALINWVFFSKRNHQWRLLECESHTSLIPKTMYFFCYRNSDFWSFHVFWFGILTLVLFFLKTIYFLLFLSFVAEKAKKILFLCNTNYFLPNNWRIKNGFVWRCKHSSGVTRVSEKGVILEMFVTGYAIMGWFCEVTMLWCYGEIVIIYADAMIQWCYDSLLLRSSCSIEWMGCVMDWEASSWYSKGAI